MALSRRKQTTNHYHALPVNILVLFEEAVDFTLTLVCLRWWFWLVSLGKREATNHRINLDLFWLQAVCNIMWHEHPLTAHKEMKPLSDKPANDADLTRREP